MPPYVSSGIVRRVVKSVPETILEWFLLIMMAAFCTFMIGFLIFLAGIGVCKLLDIRDPAASFRNGCSATARACGRGISWCAKGCSSFFASLFGRSSSQRDHRRRNNEGDVELFPTAHGTEGTGLVRGTRHPGLDHLHTEPKPGPSVFNVGDPNGPPCRNVVVVRKPIIEDPFDTDACTIEPEVEIFGV